MELEQQWQDCQLLHLPSLGRSIRWLELPTTMSWERLVNIQPGKLELGWHNGTEHTAPCMHCMHLGVFSRPYEHVLIGEHVNLLNGHTGCSSSHDAHLAVHAGHHARTEMSMANSGQLLKRKPCNSSRHSILQISSI